MKNAERLKLLQKRLAMLRLQQANKAPQSMAAEGHPLHPGQGIPPIKIELAVKAHTDPSTPQQVQNHVAPMPG